MTAPSKSSPPLARREFLRTGGALALGAAAGSTAAALSPRLLAALAPASPLTGPGGTARLWNGSMAAEVRIDVLTGETIAPVTGNHYGHFIEHLGAVIYDGVWVGEKSKIPNVGGVRKALVDDLRALTPGIVRWPGGCFADSYDWRDGTGPREQRPRRTNFWTVALPPSVSGTARYETNQFGTPEFLRFCQLVGAEPYLAANGRSLPAQDFALWVDYCNAPAGSTTMADKRAADGSREPYNVRYWGVGNEPWGCGGTLSPEEYAEQYRRYSSWVPTFPAKSSSPADQAAVQPRLIAAGPMQEPGHEEWTRRFVESMLRASRHTEMPYGYSLHSYFFRRDALDFTNAGWYSLLSEPRGLATMLDAQATALRAAGRPITLVLDEWGPWYSGNTGQTDPAHLFEQVPTLRDALVTAQIFDIFHAHADVLGIATVAQTVNCIHSLFLAKEEQFVRTPVYHTFALYQPHIGGTAVRTVAAAERITYKTDGNSAREQWVDGVSASSTLHAARDGKPGRVVVTITNPRLDQPVDATVALRGVTIKSGEVTTLTHTDPRARNTFNAPNQVQPGATTVLALASATPSGTFTLTLPPASVTRVVCTLG